MPTTEERVMCRCGLPMLSTTGGARYCENCDGIQAQERLGMSRRVTREDIRFNMHWLREMDNMKDNTKPEVGNPNTEVEGDTPDDTEGGTTNG